MNRNVTSHATTVLYDQPPADAPQEQAPVVVRRGLMSRLVNRFSVLGLIGLFIVVFWLVIAFVGPVVAPYKGGAFTSTEVFGSYSAAHLLGTDYLGRDMLSRILYGTQYTVGLALAATVAASVIGTFFGLVAAVSGRWVDEVLSRLFDALISIPSKILALVVIAAFGSSIPMLMMVAALAYIPGAFRISRSLAVNIMTLEYVQVAKARGEKLFYIARVEVLPNMIHPMLADFGLRFVFIVLLLSGLSFLGLGVQPPNADWGSLVRENIGGLAEGAPAVLMPAVAIATLTVGVNLLIDSLRRHGARSHGGGQ
ncbi:MULTISPECIES: ABC transporter permease [Caballeronia]|jgi:peptide/nickel transport system permease protein|uniref:DNA-directed RNA polymerase subunit alpha n=1 Tax=Caballeronia zhejiangensis TaxID=871203 RepID=A0A656QUJ8_9BURK|nr:MULTISPECIES: ABC transporter permease [Caballeronia]EKS71171.1 peptide ABC transporter inner membrane protein [Burkholderia sp. SJ98]KDR34191.1 DNA-directed RNA polymerase subunit alpha [Caballeronia zhejiangensis]MDR5766682.1 ABC transporter permease [Caballeronia sp. LZ028]MDR5788396.1 ABC transporter permease [Caballeronia sp. LP003]